MAVSYARRVEMLRASEVREILKITQQPDIISFAGGLPAPELFPTVELQQASADVLMKAGSQALQYSTTEGYEPLRQQIAVRISEKFAAPLAAEDILITSGSQQAIDFTGKLLLDEGDVVLCENPTYLAAISAFRSYLPQFIAVPTDDEGMIPAALADILATTKRVKLIYVIPDFQNPTGRTWSLARRQALMELASRYEIPVLEDNPYGELRFEGDMLPSLRAFDPKGLVIMTGTFSKIFCPGLRIGWLAAGRSMREKLVYIKQAADLHTSSFNQMALSEYIARYDFAENIEKIIAVYRRRRNAMVAALETHFPAEVSFTRPQGGLFLWVTLPATLDATTLLKECLTEKVAFVPGASFYPNGGIQHTLRLNYSNMPEEKITEGIIRMGRVLKEVL